MNEEQFHSVFHEIINGKSRFWFEGSPMFFLHPTPQIRSEALVLFQDWKAEAESRGLKSTDEARRYATSKGVWSLAREKEIKDLEEEISFMYKAESKLILPSQKLKQKRLIKGKEKDLLALMGERSEIFGKTSEDFAQKRASQEIIRLSIVDENDKLVWNNKEGFDDLEYNEFDSLMSSYTSMTQRINEDVIRNMVLQDFFSVYMPHCEDPSKLFGQAIIKLSSYQLKTATYGNVFFSILQRHEDLSESARKDPEHLLNIATRKKEKESNRGSGEEKTATSYFGATKEDMEALQSEGNKRVSLRETISKMSGGDGKIAGESIADILG